MKNRQHFHHHVASDYRRERAILFGVLQQDAGITADLSTFDVVNDPLSQIPKQ